MKMMMLTGAILGFGVGITFSLLRASPWPTVVWHACAAAYVAGLVFRWWGRHWMKNLRLALVEKQAAALKQAEEAVAAVSGPAEGASAMTPRVARPSAGTPTVVSTGASKR